MREFFARLVLAIGFPALLYATGSPGLEFALKLGGLFAVIAFVNWRLETKGVANAGVRGWVAVIDAACIAAALAKPGQIGTYGFLTLAPLVYATAKHGSNPSAMAPLAAGSLIAAQNLFGTGTMPTPLLVQAGAVLFIGLIANQRRIVVSKEIDVPPPHADPIAAEPPEAYMELKQSFRALRDHARRLEADGERYRDSVALVRAWLGATHTTAIETICRRAHELIGSCGFALHAHDPDGVICQLAAVGSLTGVEPLSVKVRSTTTEEQRRAEVEYAYAGLENVGVIPLRQSGKLVAYAAVQALEPSRLERSVKRLAGVAGTIADLIAGQREDSEMRSDLAEMTLRYVLAANLDGATNHKDTCERATTAIRQALDCTWVGLIKAETGSVVSSSGVGGPLESLGSQDLLIENAKADDRVPQGEALRRRIGSYAQSIASEGLMLAAADAAPFALRQSHFDKLQTLAKELALALRAPSSSPTGAATEVEFQRETKSTRTGAVIGIQWTGPEPSAAQKQECLQQIRLNAPGGAIFVRSENGYVILLRSTDRRTAEQWASRLRVEWAENGIEVSMKAIDRAQTSALARTPSNHQVFANGGR